jgi:hypothetical protein
MTYRRLLTLLPALTLSMSVACFDDKDDDDEDEDEDDDSGHGGTSWGTTGSSTTGSSTAPTSTSSSTPSVTVDWGSSAIEIDVAPRDDYWFGLTQVGFSDAWTGEDCVYGYSYDGSTLSYCHEAPNGEARLAYGGDPLDLSAGTTVFTDSSFDGDVSYYLESFDGAACWTWGADPSYYDGLGCDQL